MKIVRKISVLAMAALVTAVGFTSCSNDDLDTNQYNKSGVNILAFGPMPITRGETMRVTGTEFDKVSEVLFPEGNQKISAATTFISADFTRISDEELSVVIPDQCVPGQLRLKTTDGQIITSKSKITFSEEVKVTSIAPNPVHPGDVVTIKGEFVWNIGQVVFFDHVAVNAENFVKNTRTEIQVQVPMEAKPGDVAWNDGSDGAENTVITNLNVDVAKATGVSKATPDFGEEIIITGENLDLITTIDFPSVAGVTDFTVAEDGKSIKVKVPETSTSGSVVLNAASGLTTSVNITVPLAAVTSTNPTKDVKAGQTITIKGTNLNRITHLILPAIDGEFTNFTKSATQITFVVPEKMGDGTVVLVQHANWSVESDKISMYSEAPETTIWTGNFYIGNWNAGMQDLAWGGYDWSTVKPGQVLTVYLTPDMSQGWSQIRLGNGSWDPLPGTAEVNPLSGEDTKFSVTLTQAMIDEMVSKNGLVICGAYFTVTKITLSILEEVIWSGSVTINWSDPVAMTALAYGGYDWSKVKAGTTLKLYYEVDPTPGYINIRFGNGNWAALPSTQGWGNDGNASPDPSETSIKTVLTAADLTELTTNNGLVICGAGITCKKVVLQ